MPPILPTLPLPPIRGTTERLAAERSPSAPAGRAASSKERASNRAEPAPRTEPSGPSFAGKLNDRLRAKPGGHEDRASKQALARRESRGTERPKAESQDEDGARNRAAPSTQPRDSGARPGPVDAVAADATAGAIDAHAADEAIDEQTSAPDGAQGTPPSEAPPAETEEQPDLRLLASPDSAERSTNGAGKPIMAPLHRPDAEAVPRTGADEASGTPRRAEPLQEPARTSVAPAKVPADQPENPLSRTPSDPLQHLQRKASLAPAAAPAAGLRADRASPGPGVSAAGDHDASNGAGHAAGMDLASEAESSAPATPEPREGSRGTHIPSSQADAAARAATEPAQTKIDRAQPEKSAGASQQAASANPGAGSAADHGARLDRAAPDQLFRFEPIGVGGPAGAGRVSGGVKAQGSPTGGADHAASREIDPAAAAVTRGLAAAVSQRGGSLTIRLVPESLGFVRIQMDIAGGVVSATLDAGTAAARDLLADHLGMLRHALESRGLSVDRLQVNLAPAAHAPPAGSGGNSDAPADERASLGRFAHDAAGGRSRGGDRGDHPERHGGRGGEELGWEAGMEARESGFRLALDAVV